MRFLTKLSAVALMGLGVAVAAPAPQAQAGYYAQPVYYGYGYAPGYYQTALLRAAGVRGTAGLLCAAAALLRPAALGVPAPWPWLRPPLVRTARRHPGDGAELRR